MTLESRLEEFRQLSILHPTEIFRIVVSAEGWCVEYTQDDSWYGRVSEPGESLANVISETLDQHHESKSGLECSDGTQDQLFCLHDCTRLTKQEPPDDPTYISTWVCPLCGSCFVTSSKIPAPPKPDPAITPTTMHGNYPRKDRQPSNTPYTKTCPRRKKSHGSE